MSVQLLQDIMEDKHFQSRKCFEDQLVINIVIIVDTAAICGQQARNNKDLKILSMH